MAEKQLIQGVMKAGCGNSSSCESRGRREPAHRCSWHHARTRRCDLKGWQQPKLIPHPLLLLLLNCSKRGLEPEPSSALPGEAGQQVAFGLLIRETPNGGRRVWHWAGLQRTGPAGSCCGHADPAEDRGKLLTTDNSNEEESARQSYIQRGAFRGGVCEYAGCWVVIGCCARGWSWEGPIPLVPLALILITDCLSPSWQGRDSGREGLQFCRWQQSWVSQAQQHIPDPRCSHGARLSRDQAGGRMAGFPVLSCQGRVLRYTENTASLMGWLLSTKQPRKLKSRLLRMRTSLCPARTELPPREKPTGAV